MRAEKSKKVCDILQKEFDGDDKVRAIKHWTLETELENLKIKEREKLLSFIQSL